MNGHTYRQLAAELKAKAEHESNVDIAVELEHLALCYLRLAAQADSNATWAEFNTPPRRRGERDV